MTAELNENSDNVAYQCGRLMAVLAALQDVATNYKVKSGVIQRYYASASCTPALVFGRLIRNSHNHLDKISSGLAGLYEKRIANIWSKIQTSLPKTLSLEEQTLFAMGYYQQMAQMNKEREERKQENTTQQTQTTTEE